MTKSNKDRRLICEESLLISPSLAVIIGINEAIVLQQIHYWLQITKEKKNNHVDGFFWTYNSINKWQKNNFPFWSTTTVKRIIANLEKSGILVSGSFNRMKADRTKWYRIDYTRLYSVILGLALCRFLEGAEIPLLHNKQEQWINMVSCHKTNLALPIPDTSLPDILTNNSSIGIGSKNRSMSLKEFNKVSHIEREVDKEYLAAMNYFIEVHARVFGPGKHPKLKQDIWQKQLEELPVVNTEYEVDTVCGDDLCKMIDRYFKKKYQQNCNYSICHFNDPKIKKNVYYEVLGC